MHFTVIAHYTDVGRKITHANMTRTEADELIDEYIRQAREVVSDHRNARDAHGVVRHVSLRVLNLGTGKLRTLKLELHRGHDDPPTR